MWTTKDIFDMDTPTIVSKSPKCRCPSNKKNRSGSKLKWLRYCTRLRLHGLTAI